MPSISKYGKTMGGKNFALPFSDCLRYNLNLLEYIFTIFKYKIAKINVFIFTTPFQKGFIGFD